MLKTFVFAAIAVGAAATGGWFWTASASTSTTFREATVERDTLVVTLTATGTLEPEEVIDVGAQVAGMIREFGHDPKTDKEIDYGTVVEPTTVLAQIDDAIYKEEVQLARAACKQAHSQRAQAELAVAQSEANVKRAEADLVYAKARWAQAERDKARGEKLRNTSAISLQELDTLISMAEQMAAQVTISEAALTQAKSTLQSTKSMIEEAQGKVDQAEASLRKAEANLGYTTIRSPIHGVIIDRRVNIGQTVVASLNAPSLFLIAKDLTKLEIWASVNEADIGQIRIGQKTRFTVDAHPDDSFQGEVSQIRLNATMTQNVVTYTVVVTVDNKDNKLLPYLTANLQFQVAKKEDVLLVPNAALRWQPRAEIVHPDVPRGAPESAGGGTGSSSGRSGKGRGGNAPRNQAMVWVEDNGFVRPIPVTVGATDGAKTEVSGDSLKEGMKVVMGEVRRADASSKTVNPFQPQIFNRRQQQQQQGQQGK
ncbi:MAG: efflux RND transporter periplasmic adaptor subunit [Planctomycetaceae bacterium]|nr:efflux RND transporter periplasmic adaptor subunit [Planctomycetaceae bacterium]